MPVETVSAVVGSESDGDRAVPESRVTGQCLCGGVSYYADGPIRDVIYCHCSQCRRQTGHFVAASAVERGALQFNHEATLKWFRSSPTAERGFCGRCGSTLFWRSDTARHVAVMAGSLDDPTGIRAVAHIFVSDKGDYYDIADGLDQHAGHDHGVVFPPQ